MVSEEVGVDGLNGKNFNSSTQKMIDSILLFSSKFSNYSWKIQMPPASEYSDCNSKVCFKKTVTHLLLYTIANAVLPLVGGQIPGGL